MSDTTFDRTLVGLLARAKVTGSAHKFRRTVATTLYLENVGGHTIDKIMGWTSQAIRGQFSTDIPEPDMHRAMLKLYPFSQRRAAM